MPAPTNRFKAALAAQDRPLIGLWMAMTSPFAAEILGECGYDWLVIDGEHAPNTLPTIMGQLQALAASAAAPVVRVPIGEPWVIKQVLDVGAQTILVPMVDSAEQAAALVRAVRYPPQGMRGVGASFARAGRFGTIPDYVVTANDQIALIVQVETAAGIAAIDAIAATEGVDGVFIGPSDLAADMGHPGQPGAADVQTAIEHGLARIRAAGKAAGILATDEAPARRYIGWGATFVAVGGDVGIFRAAAQTLRARF
ncbi:MAG: aldolase/citrate lyase family protein [Gemmobacter sp.]